MSKLTARKRTLPRTETRFDLSTVFHEVVELVRPGARKKNLDFELRMDDSASESLLGVSYPLRQVLSDLLLNAVRFTRAGFVVVSVRRIPVCDAPAGRTRRYREIMFTFGENGLELSRQDVQQLFRPSARPDAAEDRKYGGSGFGLALAKKIIDLMDGKMYLLNCPNGGLAVAFSATFEKSVATRSGVPFREPAALRGKRILLAEDNDAYRIILYHLLRKWGLVPTVVSNGHRAVEEIRTRNFDLVLMDARMPSMDGLEAARSIRRLGIGPLPIIAMTGFANRDDSVRSLEAGMDDFLEKPVDSTELRRVLETWLLDPVA